MLYRPVYLKVKKVLIVWVRPSRRTKMQEEGLVPVVQQQVAGGQDVEPTVAVVPAPPLLNNVNVVAPAGESSTPLTTPQNEVNPQTSSQSVTNEEACSKPTEEAPPVVQKAQKDEPKQVSEKHHTAPIENLSKEPTEDTTSVPSENQTACPLQKPTEAPVSSEEAPSTPEQTKPATVVPSEEISCSKPSAPQQSKSATPASSEEVSCPKPLTPQKAKLEEASPKPSSPAPPEEPSCPKPSIAKKVKPAVSEELSSPKPTKPNTTEEPAKSSPPAYKEAAAATPEEEEEPNIERLPMLIVDALGRTVVLPKEATRDVLMGRVAYNLIDEHGITKFEPKHLLVAFKLPKNRQARYESFTCLGGHERVLDQKEEAKKTVRYRRKYLSNSGASDASWQNNTSRRTMSSAALSRGYTGPRA